MPDVATRIGFACRNLQLDETEDFFARKTPIESVLAHARRRAPVTTIRQPFRLTEIQLDGRGGPEDETEPADCSCSSSFVHRTGKAVTVPPSRRTDPPLESTLGLAYHTFLDLMQTTGLPFGERGDGAGAPPTKTVLRGVLTRCRARQSSI